MPSFVPQVPPQLLPQLGMAIERSVMDWKSDDTATAFHKAKDVAAFANHLGGTIIIGAVEANGVLVHYKGVEQTEAERIVREYSAAVRDRCQPFPTFEFETYPDPGDANKRIIVVNVWPSLLLTGAKIYSHKPAEGWGGVSFVYPVRVGIDADYLEPTKLAMYMTPQVRRVAVMLSRIPSGASVNILEARNGTLQHVHAVAFHELRELDNVVTFRNEAGDPVHIYPLDCIVSVYESWDENHRRSSWRMIIQFSR